MRIGVCRRCGETIEPRGSGRFPPALCDGCRHGVCSWCLVSIQQQGRHSHTSMRYCSYGCATKARWAREPGQVWPGMVCHSGLHLYSYTVSSRACPECNADARERTKAERGRLCECGCGSYTQRGNGYTPGHMPKIAKPKLPTKRDLLGTVCLCGCGQMTLSKTGYVGGGAGGSHNGSAKNTVLCLCGCGSKSWSGIGFRQGHWRSLFAERPKTERESELFRLNHRRRKARIKARAAALDGLLEDLGIPMPKVDYPEGLPKSRRQEYRRNVKARLFVELEGRLDVDGS